MTDGDQRDRLRERLIHLRTEALRCMLGRGAAWSGQPPVLASIDAALDTMPVEAELPTRAVVGDDGREIRLRLCGEAGVLASVAFDPVRAVALTGRLIEAALPRLAKE